MNDNQNIIYLLSKLNNRFKKPKMEISNKNSIILENNPITNSIKNKKLRKIKEDKIQNEFERNFKNSITTQKEVWRQNQLNNNLQNEQTNFKIDSNMFSLFQHKILNSIPDNLIFKHKKSHPTLKEFFIEKEKIEENPTIISNFLEINDIKKNLRIEKDNNMKVDINSIYKNQLEAFIENYNN